VIRALEELRRLIVVDVGECGGLLDVPNVAPIALHNWRFHGGHKVRFHARATIPWRQLGLARVAIEERILGNRVQHRRTRVNDLRKRDGSMGNLGRPNFTYS
jgi:hypothetical protein